MAWPLLVALGLLVANEAEHGAADRNWREKWNPSASPTWMPPGSATTPCKKRVSCPGSCPARATRFRVDLIATADSIINEYGKSDAPNVTEKEWIKAHNVLAKALEIDPHDRNVRGRLYLAEGHLSSNPWNCARRLQTAQRIARKIRTGRRPDAEIARSLPRVGASLCLFTCTMSIAPKTP